jgi:hypothetical protein
MAGSPLKRQLKLGGGAEDGSVIAFPRMPRVADLPPGWRHFSAAQKIEHLIGLDRCYEILSWPRGELDPLRRSMQMQVIRVLLPIGIKALLDGTLGRETARERHREEALERIEAALRAHSRRLRRHQSRRLILGFGCAGASVGKDRVARGGARFYGLPPRRTGSRRRRWRRSAIGPSDIRSESDV